MAPPAVPPCSSVAHTVPDPRCSRAAVAAQINLKAGPFVSKGELHDPQRYFSHNNPPRPQFKVTFLTFSE